MQSVRLLQQIGSFEAIKPSSQDEPRRELIQGVCGTARYNGKHHSWVLLRPRWDMLPATLQTVSTVGSVLAEVSVFIVASVFIVMSVLLTILTVWIRERPTFVSLFRNNSSVGTRWALPRTSELTEGQLSCTDYSYKRLKDGWRKSLGDWTGIGHTVRFPMRSTGRNRTLSLKTTANVLK